MRPLKVHGFKRFSVIYVSGSKYKIQDFAFVVDYQILFKTIEPADRALSFPGDSFESTVLFFSLDMTATQSGVESMNEMLVHLPKQNILRNISREVCRLYVAVQQNDCRK